MHILSFFDEDANCDGAVRIFAVISERDENEVREELSKPPIVAALSAYLEKLKPLYTRQVSVKPNEGDQGKEQKIREEAMDIYTTAILYKDTQEKALVSHGPQTVPLRRLPYELFDAFNMFPMNAEKKVILELHLCFGKTERNMASTMGAIVAEKLSPEHLRERKEKISKIYTTCDIFTFNEL